MSIRTTVWISQVVQKLKNQIYQPQLVRFFIWKFMVGSFQVINLSLFTNVMIKGRTIFSNSLSKNAHLFCDVFFG